MFPRVLVELSTTQSKFDRAQSRPVQAHTKIREAHRRNLMQEPRIIAFADIPDAEAPFKWSSVSLTKAFQWLADVSCNCALSRRSNWSLSERPALLLLR